MGLGDKMDMNNHTCPECGKKFHACSSCCLDYDFEYTYCSPECYKKSLTYEHIISKLIQLIIQARKNVVELDSLSEFIENELGNDSGFYLRDKDVQDTWYKY